MATPEPDVEGRCALHRDRQAVGRCGECGRGVCLTCAIPFRGDVLCTTCAARALGEPSPPAADEPVRSRKRGVAAIVVLVAALLLTILPWHRFGALTDHLAAWRPRQYAWPIVACLLLLSGLAAVFVGTIRRDGRVFTVVGAGLAALAAAATLGAILGAPDFVRHTAVPYVVLALAATAALIGLLGPGWRRA